MLRPDEMHTPIILTEVFCPSLALSVQMQLSHLMTLLPHAHPGCPNATLSPDDAPPARPPWVSSEALCTEGGLSLWICTWACSCPPCSTRPPQSSRSASSCPPGTWRSLALMPRQRWVMVPCVQSTFWVGRAPVSLACVQRPPCASNGMAVCLNGLSLQRH